MLSFLAGAAVVMAFTLWPGRRRVPMSGESQRPIPNSLRLHRVQQNTLLSTGNDAAVVSSFHSGSERSIAAFELFNRTAPSERHRLLNSAFAMKGPAKDRRAMCNLLIQRWAEVDSHAAQDYFAQLSRPDQFATIESLARACAEKDPTAVSLSAFSSPFIACSLQPSLAFWSLPFLPSVGCHLTTHSGKKK